MEPAGSRTPISVCASSSVNGSSEIADQMSRPARCQQGLQEGLRGRFLAPEGQQREHGGCARGPKQLLEQHGAVGVAPLEVVDADDKQLAICHAAEQLAQRGECSPPETRTDRRGQAAGPDARPRSRAPGGARGTLASTPPHPVAADSRCPGVESMRDGDSDRRPLRRAPCKARTRSRSSDRRARWHRQARRSG